MCEVVGNRICVKRLGIGYVLVKGNKVYMCEVVVNRVCVSEWEIRYV